MKPHEILAALILSEQRPVELSKRFGVTRSQISNILHRRSTNRKIQEEIARIIGKPVKEVWPELVA